MGICFRGRNYHKRKRGEKQMNLAELDKILVSLGHEKFVEYMAASYVLEKYKIKKKDSEEKTNEYSV
jgi:hypothetical protein